jgi:hypothetical protein
MDIKYVFRKPKFPLIINLDGYLIAATKRKLLTQLRNIELNLNTCYETIDASGEGFGLYVYEDCFALSPLVLKKKWTKLELIRLYNSRKNNADENIYSEKSLSAKRFNKILSDITSLLKTN